ncbi:UNVERIFIED_CONTAM: hypothetical protein FKN15_017550 [Acipenser sinensis]
MLDQMERKDQFIIGKHKPTSVSEYLETFVQGRDKLQKEGFIYNYIRYRFRISAVICDTPAHSFVKNVKSHSGYSGCDKCTQPGEWNGKMTFAKTAAPQRTDEQFNLMSDEEHHLGPSPFSGMLIGMVSQFPLDYMHSCCLGVMKLLLRICLKGPLMFRLSDTLVRAISEELIALKDFVPKEFARKPRSLQELESH